MITTKSHNVSSHTDSILTISDLLKTLKFTYDDLKHTDYQENQKLFVEMGWAIRRLLKDNKITYFDNFNDDQIKRLVFNEMNFNVSN
ncbi:hypothetical protein ACWEXK_12440 [Staphylococcus xylosus]